ncbi:MAG: LytTR family transcriptional regulator [Saprospiraceae bacterium]|nr:LytTR family transcriptional regulator [Saprospiraceae bacterium]
MKSKPTNSKEIIELDFSWLRKPSTIVLATGISVLIYTLYSLANPAQTFWSDNQKINWSFAIRHLVVDIFAIELITFYILIYSLLWFIKIFKLHKTIPTTKAILKYEAMFLPLFLGIFFVFNPITQSVRYWYFYFPNWYPDIYFAEYFYSLQLYLLYLTPITLVGYTLLNITLFKALSNRTNYYTDIKLVQNKKHYLLCFNEKGEKWIEYDEIQWFFTAHRKYYVATAKGIFQVRKKLNELEKELAENQFFRINRKVIVNLKYVDNYSFWENEKYILRMNDSAYTEFVMPRDRIVHLKKQMGTSAKEIP